MKRLLAVVLFFSMINCPVMNGQNAVLTKSVDKRQFFKDTAILSATITTDLSRILRQRQKEGAQFPAYFSATLPDGFSVNEPIVLEVRGHFRRENCYLPPIRVIFKNSTTASALKPLGSLKLVSQCRTAATDKQYVLKEFLIYKIYNLLTDMSFRVRLLNLNFLDSNKGKSVTEYAFLIEDIKDVAERNGCFDVKQAKVKTEATDRRQMTLVAIFEYMIGNTDWAVPANHNTKLIIPRTDSLHRPYVIPYDFDYSGFVNTDYAVPDENLPIQNVRERLYRGFPRSLQELTDVVAMFNARKNAIYDLVNHFDLLTSKSKKEIIGYLDEFYSIINNPDQLTDIFIRNARTE